MVWRAVDDDMHILSLQDLAEISNGYSSTLLDKTWHMGGGLAKCCQSDVETNQQT